MIVEKRIRALCDFEFSTCVTAKSFIEGEVDIIPFKDAASFQELLTFGRFEEVDDSVPVGRPPIPVLLPSIADVTKKDTVEGGPKIDLTGNLGKLDPPETEVVEDFGLTEETEEAIVDVIKEETEKLSKESDSLESDTALESEEIKLPHSYLCVQHGGSSACEEANRFNGFTCPKCKQGNSEVPTVEELQSILDGPEVPIETKSDGSIGPVEE